MQGAILIFKFILCSAVLMGQGCDVNWCFSDSAGINFNGYSPTYFYSSFTPSNNQLVNEATASISDLEGSLLFYSNGYMVWNKNNDTLSNSTGLLSNNSVTQGVLIIPKPQNDSLYYIFYFDLNVPDYGFYYSLINMNLDNGLGAIENQYKNIELLDDHLSEKLIAVKHANGRDWWILLHDLGNNSFIKFLLTPNGIISAGNQFIGSVYNDFEEIGQMAVCYDGSKIISVGPPQIIDLFDFDRCTGELSEYVDLSDGLATSLLYGCCFSPDGSKAYVSTEEKLYQFDLNATDIPDSKVLIWVNSYYTEQAIDSSYIIGQMQIAPDKKIYLPVGKFDPSTQISDLSFITQNLSVINFPDSSGADCDFVPYSFYLGGKNASYGLPNMPNYYLASLEGSACDTLTNISEISSSAGSFRIIPNPCSDYFSLEVNGYSEETSTLEIRNILGELVAKKLINAHSYPKEEVINVSQLQNGIYFVLLRTSVNESFKKIIKN